MARRRAGLVRAERSSAAVSGEPELSRDAVEGEIV